MTQKQFCLWAIFLVIQSYLCPWSDAQTQVQLTNCLADAPITITSLYVTQNEVSGSTAVFTMTAEVTSVMSITGEPSKKLVNDLEWDHEKSS
jgi:hypothetical protein